MFYQINYDLCKVEEDTLYFQAYFNRSNPTKFEEEHEILPKITGCGHFVGTYLFWQVNSNLWWGEGEVKFYLDGDTFPSICGTGTEDYFGGAWNFENPRTKQYENYSTPYFGFYQYKPDGQYIANTRFNMYRLHVKDSISFEKDLRVDVQPLGWRNNFERYLPLQDDISSVAFWYGELINHNFKFDSSYRNLEVI